MSTADSMPKPLSCLLRMSECSPVMRLQRTLALILLTAVSVNGGPIMGSGEQEETEVHAGQLSFTPSNGTLESLLEELGQDLSGIVQVR